MIPYVYDLCNILGAFKKYIIQNVDFQPLPICEVYVCFDHKEQGAYIY